MASVVAVVPPCAVTLPPRVVIIKVLPALVPTKTPPARTQRTLLLQVRATNNLARSSVLIAHDPAGGRSSMTFIPPGVLAQAPGLGVFWSLGLLVPWSLPPMIHYAVAFALLLHVLFWGAGAALLAMPRPWRRLWPVLIVPLGFALQSAVVWVGAHAGLRGPKLDSGDARERRRRLGRERRLGVRDSHRTPLSGAGFIPAHPNGGRLHQKLRKT